jgi:hypothetical protein
MQTVFALMEKSNRESQSAGNYLFLLLFVFNKKDPCKGKGKEESEAFFSLRLFRRL